MTLTNREFLQSNASSRRGIHEEDLKAYKLALLQGYDFARLSRNCNLEEEIKSFSTEEADQLRAKYRNNQAVSVIKFVPASGAASRMFKGLFTALKSVQFSDKVDGFFSELERYAFAKTLLNEAGLEMKPEFSKEEKLQILDALLGEEGLNFGKLPKGMIPFHKYENHSRTAFEEHFHEGLLYAKKQDQVQIHFTIPVETSEEVLHHLEEIENKFESDIYPNFQIETSLQKPSTDTPCIYVEDESWVENEGEPLFRPAGHGALLENLNDLDADIVFVKNIDNVVPDAQKGITTIYKELIAGALLEVQEAIFAFISDLNKGTLDHAEMNKFFKSWFGLNKLPDGEKALFDFLNRPLRVCGMVKNEGEPGGGPFMISEKNGTESLQIVEKAQIDTSNPEQAAILSGASHFNPVDLVVGMKDHKGVKFDLLKYRNPDFGMRVEKTHEGKEIYALELPGLWNGSMHHWHTVFVEVPIETFNPVKTVFDLTRPAHQA